MTPLDPLTVPLTGIRLVEASAGTGKTHAITTLVVRCLLESPVPAPWPLVVTFTTAATAELRGRVRRRVQEALAAIDGRLTRSEAGAAELITYAQRRRTSAAADRRRLGLALTEVDDAAIFTIHGFCQRVLQEFAFESGATFDAELIGDHGPLITDAAQDYWSRALFDAPAAVVTALNDAAISLDKLVILARLHAARPDLRVLLDPAADDDAVAQRVHAILGEAGAAIVTALEARKRAANVQSFDDLLLRLDEALAGPHGGSLAGRIRTRYPVALIDEFQDTDTVQYRIFRRIYREGSGGLFLIGDPKQSIYSFRGADIFSYLGAKQSAVADYTLLTNRRSSHAYVAAVNTLFGHARAPFVEAEIPFNAAAAEPRTDDVLGGAAADTAPLRMLFARRTRERTTTRRRFAAVGDGRHWIFDASAAAVVGLLNDGSTIGARRLLPGDVAVLCRRNKELHWMHAALRRVGVPAVVQGGASVFDAPEAATLERILGALATPGNAGAVRAAVTTPLLGVSGDDLAAMRVDESRWEAWVERFHRWSECWRAEGFAIAFQHLLDECAVPERVLALPGGERTMTNTLHLGELLQGAAMEARRGPLALVEWLRARRSDPAARDDLGSDATQIRLESDDRAVTLVTIHRSKGLEYDVVVCPFLGAGAMSTTAKKAWPRYHDRGSGHLTLDLNRPPGPASTANAAREALSEQLRLLYVALTRARQLCVVAWGAFSGFEESALGYLLHQPGDVPDAELIDATRVRAAELSDAEIEADLLRLAAGAGGSIAILPMPEAIGETYGGAAADAPPLRARVARRAIAQTWRVSSFTALAGSGGDDARAEEGIDRDQAVSGEQALPDGPLRGFPRGRRPGTLVHALFEHVDFTVRDRAILRATTAHWVAAFGMDAAWVEPLCSAVDDVLDTPLTQSAPPVRLRDVARARRLTEMEFAFPVALDGGGMPRPGVSAAALAAAFDRHATSPAVRAYAGRLRALRVSGLVGYLRGYIDCVFEHQGRWYVVDYKSNDRGDTLGAYAPTALDAEMARHDYVLQYHLYVVAVHRYLQQRLRHYDYARDFGGVLYLFVRGMHPSRGPATGVVFDRPPPLLVDTLSALFAAAPAGADG